MMDLGEIRIRSIDLSGHPRTLVKDGTMADDFPEENLNEDVALLRDAWVNELNAPELLSFQTDLISDLVEQVQNQQSYVDDMSADVATLTEERSFTNKLYQMEIDRIKYMLASYLRIRLRKIEQHTMHVLNESLDKMSQGEIDYAHSFKDLYEIDHPNLDAFVFCQTVEDIGNVQIDDRGSEHVNARKNDRHVLRYRVVRSLVEEGKVTLL
ncbi:hypothetical protein DYB32_004308 [Aphanomyces invadans]|uniref:DNA replication complex GINS protein SLD5 n=1 Tax=Aphanomyces invadans TaxID=157072 RepID=A0A418AXY5_9STRA|nr:hypothetical protein DYB32_004308 [Aphanomyces invadans]